MLSFLSLMLAEGEEGTPDYWLIIGVVVVVVLVVGLMVWMNFTNKKRQKEADQLIKAVGVGNKVLTIDGICGIVVEAEPDGDTLVIETGSETFGKSYIKIDRRAIWQSDAEVKKEEHADKDAQQAPAEGETATSAPFEDEATTQTESKPEEPAEDENK